MEAPGAIFAAQQRLMQPVGTEHECRAFARIPNLLHHAPDDRHPLAEQRRARKNPATPSAHARAGRSPTSVRAHSDCLSQLHPDFLLIFLPAWAGADDPTVAARRG